MKNSVVPVVFATAACAVHSLFAAPVVSDVVMTQNASRTVTVNYTLSGEPGIVTVDVQTNAGDNVWVSIGGQHLTYFGGDANRLVQPGARTITWKPRKAWPDNEVTENVKCVVSAWATNAPPDYMVVSLVASKAVEFYTSAEAVPFGVTNEIYKTDYLVLRKIPAANVRWRMGSPVTPAEVGRIGEREVPHLVTLDEDYFMGVYPVTQRQYQRLMDARPSNFKLDADYMTRPVETVTWVAIRGTASGGYDWPKNGHAVLPTSFMGKLRTFTGVDGFDLPTDAQWEFACRAGVGAALYNGKELDNTTTSVNLNPIARYKKNGGFVNGTSEPAATCTAANGTAKVGSYEPNGLGLYDMLGNVYEWCLDWYVDSLAGVDPLTGPDSGTMRVRRGGSFFDAASNNRCAFRMGSTPGDYGKTYGFLVTCSVNLQ